ncbi:hypothetical protein C1H46_024488 [Malus baccata]|uniref:Uncharacterized protein n=1 Tax=Malus baccata TaxID=106549 RepID=A0A540LTU3_MALBA|nr:hypothetical protein C1H46_024488 [Malus baccata]
MDSSSSSSTNLDYFDDMWKLQSTATLLSLSEGSGRFFHPQGSGQPADTGVIAVADSGIKFTEDVRSKDGIVFHYGFVENSGEESESEIRERLHSAGHLLGWIHLCMRNVGLGICLQCVDHFHDYAPWFESTEEGDCCSAVYNELA